MGNRSSSHYPPPQWAGPAGPYAGPAFPDGGKWPEGARRGLSGPPGAYAEPYVPHSNLRRSMMSLNADSGYLTSPGDSDRLRMRGSRMSLNHLDFDRPMIVHHDPKTLKKLEKMEKKQRKLWKKMGGRPMPPGTMPLPYGFHPLHPPPHPSPTQYPSPAQMYTRAMSYDDLHRAHLNLHDLPSREEWRPPQQQYRYNTQQINKSSRSNPSRQLGRGSVASSSPVTSSSEGRTVDAWRDSINQSTGHQIGRRIAAVSPDSLGASTPIFTSTPHQRRPASVDNEHARTVEVKVQRTERVERTETTEKPSEKQSINNSLSHSNTASNSHSMSNSLYAQPIVRSHPTYGSRSSLATSHIVGDQSEIDFSWVNEEEDKLRNERNKPNHLPECYFGMDPPNMEEIERDKERRRADREREEKENRKREHNSNVRHKAFLLEQAARKERKEQAGRARSSTHLEPRPDYSPLNQGPRSSGPAERRLIRIQKDSEVLPKYDEKQRWRSSLAF